MAGPIVPRTKPDVARPWWVSEERPWNTLRRAVDRLFEDFGYELGAEAVAPFGAAFGAGPRVDVIEDEKELRVLADLPGIAAKDLHVSVASNLLTIKGEKEEAKEEKRRHYYMKERTYGAFHRTVSLPCEVHADKISASFSHGVLTVTLPKTEAAKMASRNIPVKEG
ncbi:MAG: Hsp20/alpha crystallin family protein [Deltaproteobacteria bacterium]|nr:Hsp20/alpha crystallin family protein [Deltaproteobacteria bacterium]